VSVLAEGIGGFPYGIALDSETGHVFVSSPTAGAVFRGTLRGGVLVGALEKYCAGLVAPRGLAVDARRDRLLIADAHALYAAPLRESRGADSSSKCVRR
jgi:hypothetical protein